MTTAFTPHLYVDLGALDSTEGPQPTIGIRTDDQRLLYPRAVNVLFGPPESGKTLAASCIAADTLYEGGSVLVVDIDHNGPHATRQRLRSFGITVDLLSDPARFRYAEPDAPDALAQIIAEAAGWQPSLVLLDSIGELMPMYGGNSNDADDFTRINRVTLAAFARTGAAVLAIDHEAKSASSRDYGSSGTAAKKRAVDGIMLRVKVTQPFTPGHGGRSTLSIVKDRHGALRRASPVGESEPVAANFQLIAHGDALDWKFWTPTTADTHHDPKVEADALELDTLTPPPASTRDVQERLHWSPRRAAPALKHWRATRYPEAEGNGKQDSATCFPPPIGGKRVAAPDHKPTETP